MAGDSRESPARTDQSYSRMTSSKAARPPPHPGGGRLRGGAAPAPDLGEGTLQGGPDLRWVCDGLGIGVTASGDQLVLRRMRNLVSDVRVRAPSVALGIRALDGPPDGPESGVVVHDREERGLV